MDIEKVITRLESDLDKSTATILVSDDPEKRYFIGDALLGQAAIMLIEVYCLSFLEGFGFIEMAKKHGERTRNFIQKVRAGKLKIQDVDQEKKDLTKLLSEMSGLNIADASETGELAVRELLRESGATKTQAEIISKNVTCALTETLEK